MRDTCGWNHHRQRQNWLQALHAVVVVAAASLAANAVGCSLRATSNPLEFQTRQTGTHSLTLDAAADSDADRGRDRFNNSSSRSSASCASGWIWSRVASPRVECLSSCPLGVGIACRPVTTTTPPPPHTLLPQAASAGKMSKVCGQNGNIHMQLTAGSECYLWKQLE